MKRRTPISKYYKELDKNKSNFYMPSISYEGNYLTPLPWAIWPQEAKLLLVMLALWCVLGLFILGSASWWVASKEMGDWSYYLKRQILWYLPSLIVFLSILKTNIRDILKISRMIFLILMILILSTLIFGTTINGSSRWLILGNLQIQPSELIKPFAILEGANLFAYWHLVKPAKKLISIGLFGLLIALIMFQPNLSTAGLTGILLWTMAICGGVKIKTLFNTALLGFFSAYISVSNNDYQMTRLTTFLNPWDDPRGDGYQLTQSLIAIGSGGLFGKGFGLSMQKLQYLPIQSTDFIYAIFAEEFGLFGSILLLGFLSLFAYLSLRIAIRCRNNYTKLVAIGSATVLLSQSFIHIAVTTGSMPTTGLPLPFVSYGGNSLISSIFISGLLLRCSLESSGFIGLINARKELN